MKALMTENVGRRAFAVSLLTLPFGLFLVHCSSDTASGDTAGAPPTKSGNQIVYTSSNADGHSHTFSLDVAALSSPPSAGVSGQTSASGHTHSVSITAAQLQTINAGQSVSVTTGNAAGHVHVFTFIKIA
jgi:hypothetical protein